jgi:hypothetical protein
MLSYDVFRAAKNKRLDEKADEKPEKRDRLRIRP